MSTLTPHLTQAAQRMVASPATLFAVVRQSQVPVSIAIPAEAQSAYRDFAEVLSSHTIESYIYVAHKPTMSSALLASLGADARLDVASLAELRRGLACGFHPDRMLATGPKSDAFLRELASRRVTVVLDSLEELDRLRAHLPADARQPVLIRLSASLLGLSEPSRFGVDSQAYDQAVTHVITDSRIELRGLAYHLSPHDISHARVAVPCCLDKIARLREAGLPVSVLDIGGGYGSSYGLDTVQVSNYEGILSRALLEGRPLDTWRQHSYGLERQGARIRGSLHGAMMPRGDIGSARLAKILDTKVDGGTIADLINEQLIELWCEPGAAIWGATGVMACEVIETKRHDGNDIVVVNAHRNQIGFNMFEMLADPVLLPAAQGSGSRCEAFVAGHLCTESDMLSLRRISFDRRPLPGDVLLWSHTGAYVSGFSASQAISHPLASRYVYWEDAASYRLEPDV